MDIHTFSIAGSAHPRSVSAHEILDSTLSPRRRIGAIAVVVLMLVALLPLASASPALADDSTSVPVVVVKTPGAGEGPESLVEDLGGRVEQRLDIINGFSAILPESAVETLAANPEVRSVTPNARVRIPRWETDDKTDDGSMHTINRRVLRSTYFWSHGYTGAGVTVAMIDTGIVPVPGLTVPGKIINGPDLSLESSYENLRYLDAYGHGTHLAGIIAGRDDDVRDIPRNKDLKHHFVGVAPGARILNVKVGDAVGEADISQVIAAIGWVVKHRDDNDMNVRVLNLAFSVDSDKDYRSEPLAYAVEAAWKAGIVVVVAADGNDAALRSPAFDPFVIAVGADDPQGTSTVRDDEVPEFSNCGTNSRSVDLIAPGHSIISLRDPGSFADYFYPEARVGDRFFRGTGTSQAAAMVSGATALLLQQRPDLTPDQVKALLTSTARPIPEASDVCQGGGLIDLKALYKAPTPDATQTWQPATNPGTYDPDAVDGSWENLTWGNLTWGNLTWGNLTWGNLTWGNLTWGNRNLTWGNLTWGSYLWN
ncbi:MAG: S8 family serine peptidase [Gammaproteobacteria bacterium]|nr:S8 family serine peptidase [Gammaproteobacteria bacterium]